MSNIDKQQIRDDIAIRKSMPELGVRTDHNLARLKAIQDTRRSFSLEVVEALLDENDNLLREKDVMESAALAMRDDMRDAREKLEAAENRIAELESITDALRVLRPGHITIAGEKIGIYMRDEVDAALNGTSAGKGE